MQRSPRWRSQDGAAHDGHGNGCPRPGRPPRRRQRALPARDDRQPRCARRSFVALKGERFDGHDFVPAALAQGAAAALVASDRAPALVGALVAVPDPLVALGQLAAYWRRQFTLPLTMIVGSNGKTTVKEMLAGILRADLCAAKVLATEGNLNNAIGVPLTLLRLKAGHRAAVVELGMNHRGETRELAAIAQPTIAVISNARASIRNSWRVSSGGRTCERHRRAAARRVNGDQHRRSARGGWLSAAPTRASCSDVRARSRLTSTPDVRRMPTAANSEIVTPAGVVHVWLAVPGRHMARNALARRRQRSPLAPPLRRSRRGSPAFAPSRAGWSRCAPRPALVLDDTYAPIRIRCAPRSMCSPQHREHAGWRWATWARSVTGPAFHREIGAYAREQGVTRLMRRASRPRRGGGVRRRRDARRRRAIARFAAATRGPRRSYAAREGLALHADGRVVAALRTVTGREHVLLLLSMAQQYVPRSTCSATSRCARCWRR